MNTALPNEIGAAQLYDLVMHAPAAMAVLKGPHLVFEFANDKYLQTVGIHREIIGIAVSVALPEFQQQGISEIMKNVYRTGKTYEGFETPLTFHNNIDQKPSHYYFNCSYSPIYDANRNIEGVLVHAIDVTELVTARQKAAANEKRFRQLILQAPNAMAVYRGKDLVIEMVNNAWKKLTNQYGDVIGKKLEEVIPSLKESKVPELLRKVIRTCIPINETELLIDLGRKDVNELYLNYVFSPLLNDEGVVEGVITMSTDVTQQVIARKQKEQAQKSETRLLKLVENSVDLMSILGMDGKNLYINKAGKHLLGLGEDEDFTQIPISDFHTPEQLAFVETEILPNVMGKGKWSGRFAAKHTKTGEILPLENNCFRIDDPVTGEPVAVGAIMRDLRPELAAQQQLKESEERFRNMILQAPLAISLMEGENMCIVSANKEILKLWGKDESVIGKDLIDALPEIKSQGFLELLQNVYKTGEAYYSYEALAKLNRNGQLHDGYYDFVYAPIEKTTAGRNGVMVIAIDVTDQVKAKHALRQSEEHFRRLILEAPTATALYRGREMRIEVANEAMLKLWGKDASVVGKILRTALPELEGQPFHDLLDKVYTSGEAYHTDMQSADLVVDGKLQTFWFNFTYKPLHDMNGNVFGILNMAVDITKQVQLQQQKDEFMGIASHELKTPVTSIKAYAQVLQAMMKEKNELQEAAMLGRMDAQLNRLTALIGNLLDVTKINAGKLDFNEMMFSLTDSLKETVQDLQTLTGTHTILLTAQEDVYVNADKDRIEQVITNLITNAVKYSPKADKVYVGLHTQNNEVFVSVRDEGIGIPADQRSKVFEQFFRVQTAHTLRFSGLGLGLYISSVIIQRSNGRIWLESEEGKGSVFSFALAVAKK